MSYDAYVGCWSGNYTSNVSGMWADAIGESLGDLIDRMDDPKELLPHLERGIAAMAADPEKYRAMNPKNGWGDYEGALKFLREIAEQCRDYEPRPIVSVWR